MNTLGNRTLIDMNFSRWKKLRQCPQQYYANYINPQEESEWCGEDASRAWVGQVIQRIFELAIKGEDTPSYLTTEEGEIGKGLQKLMDEINDDLNLLKNEHIVSLPKGEESKHDWINPQKLVDVKGAKHLFSMPRTHVSTDDLLSIEEASSNLISFVREKYQMSFPHFMHAHSAHTGGTLTCEEKFSGVIVTLDEPGYDDIALRLKGTIDFVFHTSKPVKVLDGKKSDSSYLDPDQLDIYSMLVAQGDPILDGIEDCNFWIWDSAREWKVSKRKGEYKSTVETRTTLVKSMMDELKKILPHCKGKDSNPDKFIHTPSYGSCMFCVKQDNCLARGTNKEDLTEI